MPDFPADFGAEAVHVGGKLCYLESVGRTLWNFAYSWAEETSLRFSRGRRAR